MPIYTYRCRGCGEVFDLLEGMNAEKVRRQCPRCSGDSLTKIPAAFNVGPDGVGRSPGSDFSCPACPTGPAGCAGGACPF